MEILHPPSFLALGLDQQYAPPAIFISPDFSEVISRWRAGTRCSPLWRIRSGVTIPEDRLEFNGKHLVVLLGPVQVAMLTSDIKEASDPRLFSIWASIGTLNVVLIAKDNSRSRKAIDKVSHWASERQLALEYWVVNKGRVVDGKVCLPSGNAETMPTTLIELAKPNPRLDIESVMQEYCALTASAISRAKKLLPRVYADFLVISDAISEEVKKCEAGEIPFIDVYLRLLNINAALSRFTSQTFSGIPPVLQTECHYWIHSLLGTGSANIAISHLSAHIRQTLGEARIPERLKAMASCTEQVPSRDELTSGAELLNKDHLAHFSPVNKAPLVPVITYFSGRDGFSSHIYTLSAPLTTIAACNSLRSSLLTITHEVSHIQIRGVLSVVYPNLKEDEEILRAKAILTPHFRATNWLEAGKQLLLEGLLCLDTEWHGIRATNVEIEDTERMRQKLRRVRREAQEILVHAFDFLYFYSGKPAVYVNGIWHSWCAIPGIVDRVSEYVIRTLCAIGANHLDIENPAARMDAIRSEALDQFQRIRSTGGLVNAEYIDEAIRLLEQEWTLPNGGKGISEKLRAGLVLTRFVKIFLFSETFAAQVFSDSFISSSHVTERGYKKKRNTFDLVPIGNPLRFLAENIMQSPSDTESLWVLHNLAFNSAGSSHR